jgi:hypothetical protein
MADKRAFAKFDVGYLDNPKMLDVLDASSNAILMHFASVLYCAQHLTDGVVASKAMQRKAGGSDADVQILLTSGLWHEPGHDCDGCPEPPAGKVYVHDFLEHNRDAANAKRVSEKRSEVATAMWDKKKAMQIALQPALQNEPACNAERERKKEKDPSRPRKKPVTLPASGPQRAQSKMPRMRNRTRLPGRTFRTPPRRIIAPLNSTVSGNWLTSNVVPPNPQHPPEWEFHNEQQYISRRYGVRLRPELHTGMTRDSPSSAVPADIRQWHKGHEYICSPAPDVSLTKVQVTGNPHP